MIDQNDRARQPPLGSGISAREITLQYFAIVWCQEKNTLARVFRTQGLRLWKPLTLVLFVVVGLSYGVLVEVTPSSFPLVYQVSLVVSIMHFWYDGFVWSVQRRQV